MCAKSNDNAPHFSFFLSYNDEKRDLFINNYFNFIKIANHVFSFALFIFIFWIQLFLNLYGVINKNPFLHLHNVGWILDIYKL